MGRNVQLLAVQVYSQCGARGVRGARGAVFRDIAVGVRVNLKMWKCSGRLEGGVAINHTGPV